MNNDQLAQKIRETRATKRQTQKEVADIIGVSAVTIGHWETNTKRPRTINIIQIERWMGQSVEIPPRCAIQDIPTEELAKELIRRGLKVSF